jgi:FKBP-type peptidyl-prolyl cis-trans isomerase FklB
MHVGDRWKVVIPARLAYGEDGELPRIGPNEALVFEIELLDIKPGSDAP